MGSCSLKQPQIQQNMIIQKQCSCEEQNEETQNMYQPPLRTNYENIKLDTASEECDIYKKIYQLQITKTEPLIFQSKNSIAMHSKDGLEIQINYSMSEYSLISFKDGSQYEGYFQQGLIHGFGKFTDLDNNVYIGQWFQNKKHGYGKEVVINHYTYQGQFFNNFKQGKGFVQYEDNTSYEGQFENNHLNGFGVYQGLNGLRYEGYWVDNQMDGQGKLTLSNKSVYEGYFKQNKKHGYGIYTWTDGKQYKGYWKDDTQNGEGELIKQDGQPILTKYQNGKRIVSNLKILSPISLD